MAITYLSDTLSGNHWISKGVKLSIQDKPSKRTLLSSACMAMILAGLGYPAHAQTIDYGSLEALFGEPVTTSATGQPQRASDVPVTMEIITAEDIRRSGAPDIPGVLRNVSGMSVWEWTRLNSDVSVRGYNTVFSSRLLVLVNGRQVYNDDYGHVAWEAIPIQLEEIRQIEIVKGPNSALFGFNAVGGVVNIITYNPIYDDVSSAGARVGTDSYYQGHLVHTHKFSDKVSVRVSGGKTIWDEYDAPAGTTYLDPDLWAFSLDGVAEISESAHLRFELSKSASEQSRFVPTYTPGNSRHETRSAKLSLVSAVGDGIFQANLYHNGQDKKDGGPVFPFELDNNVTVAQAEYLFPVGSEHNFRIQTEYRHNTLKGLPLLVTPGSNIFYDVYAAGGMWNWKLQDDLAWTNAVRVDHLELGREGPIQPNAIITSNADFDRNLTEYSYNSGLVWQATEKDTLRLMTARGVQAPSLFDMGQTIVIGPVVVIGNPDLDPSIVTNYEIGYDRKIEEISGGFRASLFYQKTQDIKSDSVIAVGLTSQPGNIGDSSTVGLELGLEGAFADYWTWDANYKIQDINDDISVNQGGTVTSPYNAEKAEPTHALNLHLGYAKGKWEADAFANYVSDYNVLLGPAPFTAVNAGDFVSLSGRVGYKLTDSLTVALSGQQIAETDVQETSAPGRERQVFLSLTTKF